MVFSNYSLYPLNCWIILFYILPNKSVAEGAFLGAITYGIFDFSNHAIFKNYGLTLAIIDMTWGTFYLLLLHL